MLYWKIYKTIINATLKLNLDDIIVYTSLIGDHEGLNDQPQIKKSKIRHVCLTDDKSLRSDQWEIINVERIFPQDPHRSQRNIKIRPHLFFKQYKYSLYFDNSIILKEKTENFIDMISNELKINIKEPFICVPFHSFRKDLISEFNECASLRLDTQIRIYEQLNDYMKTNIDFLKSKPYWAGILFRNHKHKDLIRFSEIWFSHICKYSKRDQLSILYSANQANLKLSGFELNNSSSKFHKWPVKKNRLKNKNHRENLIDLKPYKFFDKLSKELRKNQLILNEKNAKKRFSLYKLLIKLFLIVSSKIKDILKKFFNYLNF